MADQIRDVERNDAKERERRKEDENDEMEQWDMARRAGFQDRCCKPTANAKDVTRLRSALPNGKKVDGRFLSVDIPYTPLEHSCLFTSATKMLAFGMSVWFPITP